MILAKLHLGHKTRLGWGGAGWGKGGERCLLLDFCVINWMHPGRGGRVCWSRCSAHKTDKCCTSCSHLTSNRNNNWTNVLPGLGLRLWATNEMHANELNNEQPDLARQCQLGRMVGSVSLGLRSAHCATNFQLQQGQLGQQQLEHYGPSGSVKVSVSQQECTLIPLKGCARMSDQQRQRQRRQSGSSRNGAGLGLGVFAWPSGHST